MRKTKTRKILEYIKANQPCKAKAICEALFEKRHMSKQFFNTKAYDYYVGWSGYRVFLTRWGYNADKSKIAIKLTKDGYVLTKYGDALLTL